MDVQFIPPEESPYIKSHVRYAYSELYNIFDETDVLVVPSICYETFGYTVLEALSFGVPVIITKNVGAKDVLADGAGIIIEDVKSNQLFEVFKNLDTKKLQSMNRTIINDQSILTIEEVTKRIELYCYH